jgi:hypothetical protein
MKSHLAHLPLVVLALACSNATGGATDGTDADRDAATAGDGDGDRGGSDPASDADDEDEDDEDDDDDGSPTAVSDSGTGSHDAVADASPACESQEDCDDGVFCNGEEQCDAELGCVPGDLDLSDGLPCTVDSCDEDEDRVDHEPNDDLCADDLACNGIETCDETDGCQAAESACNELCATCSEGDGMCVQTPKNVRIERKIAGDGQCSFATADIECGAEESWEVAARDVSCELDAAGRIRAMITIGNTEASGAWSTTCSNTSQGPILSFVCCLGEDSVDPCP